MTTLSIELEWGHSSSKIFQLAVKSNPTSRCTQIIHGVLEILCYADQNYVTFAAITKLDLQSECSDRAIRRTINVFSLTEVVYFSIFKTGYGRVTKMARESI